MEKRSKVFIGVLIVMQVLLLAGVVGLFFQNRSLASSVKEYVASTGGIHEIYDNTKVVEAYKNGKSDGLNEQEKFILEKAQEIIKENIKDGMTDYEKEKAIYDWQVAYVAYNENNLSPITAGEQYSHLPYGVLKYREAICVGNATTFKLFMDMLGIENKFIHSTTSGEHAWNVIKLDGEWYHADVTFDGGLKGKPAYGSFNVPDSVKDNGIFPWNHEEIPAAEGIKYCYLAKEAKELKDIYALPGYIKEQLKEKRSIITFKLKDAKGYNQEIADFLAGSFMAENMEISSSETMVIGAESIYTYAVVDMGADLDLNEESQKIIDKLQEIIDGLQ